MTTIAIFITSAIVACCGYIITENNADSLLAGFNKMNKKEKEKFDLKGYLENKNLSVYLLFKRNVCLRSSNPINNLYFFCKDFH